MDILIKGLTNKSGNFVIFNSNNGYFNHNKNKFELVVRNFDHIKYDSDENVIKDLHRLSVDEVEILLIPIFSNISLENKSNFIMKLHSNSPGIKTTFDFINKNGIKTRSYVLDGNDGDPFYRYVNLFNLKTVSGVDDGCKSPWASVEEKFKIKDVNGNKNNLENKEGNAPLFVGDELNKFILANNFKIEERDFDCGILYKINIPNKNIVFDKYDKRRSLFISKVDSEKLLFDLLESNYYNINKKTINIEGELECRGFCRFLSDKKGLDDKRINFSRTSLDLTLLKQNEIVGIYRKLTKIYGSMKSINDTGILFGFKPNITNDGVFIEIGYFEYGYANTKVGITDFSNKVSEFYKKNTDVRFECSLRKSSWFKREVFNVSVPPEKTRIVYVCVFPESNIVKVGKTVNWESREKTYKRGDGESPETRSYMKLVYWFATPIIGDKVVDNYLMGCVESWLIKEAHKKYNIFEGKEFFKGDDDISLVDEIRDSIFNLSIPEILSQRTDYQIKTHCRKEKYKEENLYEKFMELKYNK